MLRKKNKRAVTSSKGKRNLVKRQVKAPKLSAIESLEKGFRDMPAKIAALHRKDFDTSKKQEKKLNSELKKAQAKNKIAKKKWDGLASKSTGGSKKQMATAKKIYDNSNTHVSQLTAQLDQIKKAISAIAHKQAKFMSLGKQLVILEKEFEATLKKAASQTKPKARKKQTAKAKVTTMPEMQETVIQPEEQPITITTTNEPVEYNS